MHHNETFIRNIYTLPKLYLGVTDTLIPSQGESMIKGTADFNLEKNV